MLKRIFEIKKGLMLNRWVIQDKELIYQPTFFKTEINDDAISFEFSVDIAHDKLEGRKPEIAKDSVEQIDKEIETSIRKGSRK